MTERYITPSKITAWLDCAHFLSLKHQVEDGLREAPAGGMGSFARLLADKGIQHETACLDDYVSQGLRVLSIPTREPEESFTAWTTRVGDPFGGDWDVIYQMPLIHQGIRGIADFLIRVVSDNGTVTWEPLDAKLARQEAKPGHVLQLCFYADAIEARTGRRPERMHLWLGSGDRETLAVNDFGAYWRRLRLQLQAVLDAPDGPLQTVPEPCDHCAFCEFADVCDTRWRSEDSLIYVAGLRSGERTVLQAAGVSTLADLAVVATPVAGLRPERAIRVAIQARLQVQARDHAAEPPPYELIVPSEDPTWGRGFDQLPARDEADVFLDFEGHPFWRADCGLFFLFGLIEQNAEGVWNYRQWWAHSQEEEGIAAAALIAYLTSRRGRHPGMHVYHYNHTERSSLERLAETHGVGEVALTHLVETGAFVDLLVVARNAVQVGTESYGLKALEKLTDYERGHDIDQGAGAVLEYERYMTEGAADALVSIAAYNEDDVRATRALRDWLIDHRPAGLPWRAAELEPGEEPPELEEQVAQLHAFGPGTVEHLLGDVLGYWRREWFAHVAPLRARCDGEYENLLDDPESIAGLIGGTEQEQLGKSGKPITLSSSGRRNTLTDWGVLWRDVDDRGCLGSSSGSSGGR